MGKKYDVVFALAAAEDLDQIYRYISEELFASQVAEGLMAKIEQSILHLGDYPYSCPIVSEALVSRKKYHKLVVDRFIVFYTVNDAKKKVEIARVVYALRAYRDLL